MAVTASWEEPKRRKHKAGEVNRIAVQLVFGDPVLMDPMISGKDMQS